jgi:hypothetical protein
MCSEYVTRSYMGGVLGLGSDVGTLALARQQQRQLIARHTHRPSTSASYLSIVPVFSMLL